MVHLSRHDRIYEGNTESGSLGSKIEFHGDDLKVYDFEAQHNHIPSLEKVDYIEYIDYFTTMALYTDILFRKYGKIPLQVHIDKSKFRITAESLQRERGTRKH